MRALEWIAAILAGAGWLWLAAFHHNFWRFSRSSSSVDARSWPWPSVVAVVPARNEADVIERALRSLVDQHYPGQFAIIVVNDNSSDNTADVACRVQGAITVHDAQPLTKGWAGKLAALQQGVLLADNKFPQADYFWFTDADIVHKPQVLHTLMALALSRNRQLVSQMVRLHCQTPVEKFFVPAFIFFFAMLYPFSAINDHKKSIAGAAGGSVLMDRRALKAIGGLTSLKGELIDDCALARRVKGAGYSIWLELGHDSESIRPYTFKEFWNMVSRSAFVQLHHSYALLTVTFLGLGILFVLPLVLFVTSIAMLDAPMAALAFFSFLTMMMLYRPILNIYGLHPLYGLALPAVSVAYLAMTLNSAFLHARGKGSQWKGRAYTFLKNP